MLSEKSTDSSCGADLVPGPRLLQAELQNLFCLQMPGGDSKPLLTFKPPYVWNLVAQKDQPGGPALGGMGQMPTLGYTSELNLVLQQHLFLPSCRRYIEGYGPGHVETRWEVSDSSWASFPSMSLVFVWDHSEIKWWAACKFRVAGPSGLVYDLLPLRFFAPMYPFCNKKTKREN